VERAAVHVALGVTPAGERQVLGYWLLPSENALSWEEVLKGLWHRGLKRVLLFISDGLGGLQPAIQRVYPLAEWPLPGAGAGSRAVGRRPAAGVPSGKPDGGVGGFRRAPGPRWGGRYPGVVRLWWVCASTTTPSRYGPISGAPIRWSG